MFMPGIGRVAIIPNGPRPRRCSDSVALPCNVSRNARRGKSVKPTLCRPRLRARSTRYVHPAPAVGSTETLIDNDTGRGSEIADRLIGDNMRQTRRYDCDEITTAILPISPPPPPFLQSLGSGEKISIMAFIAAAH